MTPPTSSQTYTRPSAPDRASAEVLDRSQQPPDVWMAAYARLLAGALVPLPLHHGVAAEAHSQNSVIRFVEGRPVELVLRDLGGIRARRPWMRGAPDLHPASLITAGSLDELVAKGHHTWLQGHVAPLATVMSEVAGMPETVLWKPVRAAFHEAFDREEHAADTRAAFFAPRIHVKALTRMGLGGRSHHHDFREVDNPLHRRAFVAVGVAQVLGVTSLEMGVPFLPALLESLGSRRAPSRAAWWGHCWGGASRVGTRRHRLRSGRGALPHRRTGHRGVRARDPRPRIGCGEARAPHVVRHDAAPAGRLDHGVAIDGRSAAGPLRAGPVRSRRALDDVDGRGPARASRAAWRSRRVRRQRHPHRCLSGECHGRGGVAAIGMGGLLVVMGTGVLAAVPAVALILAPRSTRA